MQMDENTEGGPFAPELAVCSLNAVRAQVKEGAEEIRRLFLRADRMTEFSPLCKQLAQLKRPYKICEDVELERVSKTPHHQGIVVMIRKPEVPPLTREDLEIWSRESLTGIVLHGIENDFNLGALVRQAAFFDVRYVIISEWESAAHLSTAAYRTAEGGMMFVTLRSVRRTEAFVCEAAKSLLVIGADVRARRHVRDLSACIERRAAETGRRPGVALVIGNEERGLPGAVKEHCSDLLRIRGTGNIESLNVAQAAALFCHEIFESAG
jgi:TrmH RNA methyltransferase